MMSKEIFISPSGSNPSFFNDVLKYRWLIWLLLVATYMISFFHRMSISVVKELITVQFCLSATEFGAIASMYFYAYCITQIPAGILVDSIGVRLTATLSMLIATVATVLFGYASSTTMLYVSRFAVGVGVAASFVCVMKIQSQWFKEREFSTLSGMCLFIGNLGSLSAQAPLAFLVALVSFKGAFLSISIGTLALGVLCFAFVRNTPQDMGFAPINQPSVAQAAASVSLGRSLKQVLTHKKLIPLYIFYFFAIPQFLTFAGTWSTSYIQDVYGLSLTYASNIASLQVVGFMCGSLMLGFFSDKAGKRKPFFVVPNLVLAVLWIVLTCAGGPNLPVSMVAMCLFCIGFCTGTFSVMMAICKEHSPRESTGSAIASLNTFGFLGIALATPIYGYILDTFAQKGTAEQHGYALLFLAALTGISFTLTLLVTETFGKNVHAEENV